MAKRKPSKLNLLLAVDKPIGCTSHDVVARVRRALGERRVGHAGTLDPLATGVMIVGVGQATRLLGQITLDSKSYIADIAFGCETNTDDADGQATREVLPHAKLLDSSYATGVLSGFLGESQQVPPAFSAISIDGVRCYKRARDGEDVEIPARPIHVAAADLITVTEQDGAPVWTVAFTVSKGTYIRALARDIGRAADAAAHVASLRRTASGGVTIGMCADLETLDPSTARAAALDPAGILGLPSLNITDDQLADVLLGRSLDATASLAEQPHQGRFALMHAGQLRAIARAEKGRLCMESVFPQGIEGGRAR